MNINDLAPLRYGTGERERVLFIDTQCVPCQRRLAWLPTVRDRVIVNVLPILIGKAGAARMKLYCCASG